MKRKFQVGMLVTGKVIGCQEIIEDGEVSSVLKNVVIVVKDAKTYVMKNRDAAITRKKWNERRQTMGQLIFCLEQTVEAKSINEAELLFTDVAFKKLKKEMMSNNHVPKEDLEVVELIYSKVSDGKIFNIDKLANGLQVVTTIELKSRNETQRGNDYLGKMEIEERSHDWNIYWFQKYFK